MRVWDDGKACCSSVLVSRHFTRLAGWRCSLEEECTLRRQEWTRRLLFPHIVDVWWATLEPQDALCLLWDPRPLSELFPRALATLLRTTSQNLVHLVLPSFFAASLLVEYCEACLAPMHDSLAACWAELSTVQSCLVTCTYRVSRVVVSQLSLTKRYGGLNVNLPSSVSACLFLPSFTSYSLSFIGILRQWTHALMVGTCAVPGAQIGLQASLLVDFLWNRAEMCLIVPDNCSLSASRGYSDVSCAGIPCLFLTEFQFSCVYTPTMHEILVAAAPHHNTLYSHKKVCSKMTISRRATTARREAHLSAFGRYLCFHPIEWHESYEISVCSKMLCSAFVGCQSCLPVRACCGKINILLWRSSWMCGYWIAGTPEAPPQVPPSLDTVPGTAEPVENVIGSQPVEDPVSSNLPAGGSDAAAVEEIAAAIQPLMATGEAPLYSCCLLSESVDKSFLHSSKRPCLLLTLSANLARRAALVLMAPFKSLTLRLLAHC